MLSNNLTHKTTNMKITIEPTDKQSFDIQTQNPTVVVTVNGDDHTIKDVMECLVIPALKAFGYFIEPEMVTINLSA